MPASDSPKRTLTSQDSKLALFGNLFGPAQPPAQAPAQSTPDDVSSPATDGAQGLAQTFGMFNLKAQEKEEERE